VQQVPYEEVVRVALVELGAVAGGRVDQQGAEQRQDERGEQYRPVEAPDQGVTGEEPGPAGALGPVAGDLEAVDSAGHVTALRVAGVRGLRAARRGRPPPRRRRRRVSRLPASGEGTVAPCWSAGSPWSSAGGSAEASGDGWAVLAGSLGILGDLMVPSALTLGRLFCGSGSSAFFLSILPSSVTP